MRRLELTIQDRGTLESAGHSGKLPIQRAAERAKREGRFDEAPIALGGDPEIEADLSLDVTDKEIGRDLEANEILVSQEPGNKE
jgi:hypothetical protein